MAGMPIERRPPRPARVDPRAAELLDFAREAGYRITERIGAGGMGIVYRAIDADGRDVAMKLLRHEIADDPRARERLAREVASQRRLAHDGVARVLDAELDSRFAFVITEFIPGPTLETAVDRHGPLHPELVREIGMGLGETLLAVHQADVIHRDLKPSNIMLRGAIDEDFDGFDPEGDGLDPVIIDFGIALAAEESRMTSTGLMMGTAAYMDPEVIRTDRATREGDWWSMAAVLAFAATGRPPFGTGRADAVFFRADRGELDVDDLPVELASWLRESLRADPEARLTGREQLETLARLDLSRPPEPSADAAYGAAALSAWAAGEDRAGAADRSGATGQGEDTDEIGPDGEGGAGPHAVGSGGTHDAGSGLDEAVGSAEAPTAQFAPVADDDALTQPLAGGAGRDEVSPRTEVLSRTEALARTEALPSGGSDDSWTGSSRGEDSWGEDSWNGGASGRVGDEPATEALPRMETPTAAMPVVRPAQGPVHQSAQPVHQPQPPVHRPAPVHHAPQQPVQHQYPPQQGYPPQQPPDPHTYAAQQGYSGHQGYAGQQGYPAQHGFSSQQGYPGQLAYPGQMAQPIPAPLPPPRRRILAWLGHLALVGLGAVAPFISLALMLVLGTLARTWERLARGRETRRARGEGDGTLEAVFTSPFRLLQGLLELVLQAFFPLILGLLLGVGADALLSLRGSILPESAIFAIAIGTTVLLTWVGIGSRTTRNGVHRMLAAATPDGLWTGVITLLMLVVLAAIAVAILARGGSADYIPFFQLPRLTGFLPWRP